MLEFTSFVEFMEAGGWDERERSPDDCARRCAEFGIRPTRTGPECLKESTALLDFLDLHTLAPKEWADMGRSLMIMGLEKRTMGSVDASRTTEIALVSVREVGKESSPGCATRDECGARRIQACSGKFMNKSTRFTA